VVTLVLAGLLLLILSLTYALGRRTGYAWGRRAAELEAPLIMKEEALRAGRCPTCGATAAGPSPRE
jgi:hypothetical protein